MPMHEIGHPCPVAELAKARFGPELGTLVLWELTCFPADDATALEQLKEVIRRVDAGETIDQLRVESEQQMEAASASWREHE